MHLTPVRCWVTSTSTGASVCGLFLQPLSRRPSQQPELPPPSLQKPVQQKPRALPLPPLTHWSLSFDCPRPAHDYCNCFVLHNFPMMEQSCLSWGKTWRIKVHSLVTMVTMMTMMMMQVQCRIYPGGGPPGSLCANFPPTSKKIFLRLVEDPVQWHISRPCLNPALVLVMMMMIATVATVKMAIHFRCIFVFNYRTSISCLIRSMLAN